MQRVDKFEDLNELINIKKRKRSLSIDKIYSLPCEICKTEVINFELCSGHHVHCSLECLEILYLRALNNNESQSSFSDDSMILDK